MTAIREDIVFRMTGAQRGQRSGALDRVGLRPALFARFGDLSRLRYDLPAVLVEPVAKGASVLGLTYLIDDALRSSAPRGMAGERARQTALRVEREIRSLVAASEAGRLSSLWERAVERLAATGGGEVMAAAAQVWAAIPVDGQVVACDARGVERMVECIWRSTATQRAAALRRSIDEMIVRLEGIVAADVARSAAGRDADHLRASVGVPQRALFDFDEMARLLARPSRGSALTDERRERIARLVATLRSHRSLTDDLSRYVFDDLGRAVAAYRQRLPAMAELTSALAMGELETTGAYAADKHDPFFRSFDERSLTPDDLARFPDPLVRVGSRALEQGTEPLAACASGVPLKVLVETDDAFGIGSRLASTALGLGDAFVVQAASSDLVRLALRLGQAMEHRGPSLLSVFVPAATTGIPPYLVAAAATESRAFPTFVYDPSAEGGWSERLSLDGDPQLGRTWPIHELRYADAHLQRVTESVPFTLADLAICDERRSGDLARVADGSVPSADLVPLGAWLEKGKSPSPTAAPYVNAIDADDRLVRLVVDDRLVSATRRSGEAWKRLVELAGIGTAPASSADVASEGSHLAPTLAPAGAPGDAGQKTRAPADGASWREIAHPSSTSASDAGAAAGPEATSPTSADVNGPYIETVRCATCNECTNLNPRMFAYNDDRQAYIADVTAGSYRDLVEAAEACQVAIIHPGKPRDPNEPGLAELAERAAAFA